MNNMEEDHVKCESGSESDSLNTELAHVEEHFESRFHPNSNIICVWRSILYCIQCLILFCSPRKNKSS